jgi:hypothetical protein
MATDRLIDAKEAAKLLGQNIKTVRRWDSDTRPSRDFPHPVLLPSPSGRRPIKRWRLSDILRFGRLDEE